MNEKAQVILQVLAKRIRTVAFVVAGLLLGLSFLLSATDSAPASPEPPAGPDMGMDGGGMGSSFGEPMAKPDDLIRIELAKNNGRAATSYPNLVKYSMFVQSDVVKESGEEKVILAKLAEARTAMIAKNYQEASKKIDEVLAMQPTRKGALALKKEITAKAGF